MYWAVVFIGGGRVKPSFVIAEDYESAKAKVKARKEREGWERAVIYRKRTFESAIEALSFAREMSRKFYQEEQKQEAETEETKEEEEQGEEEEEEEEEKPKRRRRKKEESEGGGERGGYREMDLEDIRRFLPGMMASISETIYYYFKKPSVKSVKLLVEINYWDGRKETVPLDLELEKEEGG